MKKPKLPSQLMREAIDRFDSQLPDITELSPAGPPELRLARLVGLIGHDLSDEKLSSGIRRQGARLIGISERLVAIYGTKTETRS